MNDEKRKALEVAGWKFGNAEDFFKEIIVNFDAAVRDSITIARSLAARSEDYQKAACVLAAEVERLRAELAIYTSPKKMTIKKLPWMCGNCGKQTVDCIRPYTGSDGESLLSTCSNCGAEWVS